MHGRTKPIVLVLAVAVLVGCTDEIDPSGRRGVRRFQLEKAVAKGDGAAIGALYLENAKFIPPETGEPVTGRAAIQALWQARMDDGLEAIDFVRKSRRGEGDLSFEMGTYTSRNVAGEIDVGKYFIVWQLVDGAWFISRYTWASDLEGDDLLNLADGEAEPAPDAATE